VLEVCLTYHDDGDRSVLPKDGDGPERDGRTAFTVFPTDNLELAPYVPLDPVLNPDEAGILEEGPRPCPVQNDYDCSEGERIEGARSVIRGPYINGGRMTVVYMDNQARISACGRGAALLGEAGPGEEWAVISFVMYVGRRIARSVRGPAGIGSWLEEGRFEGCFLASSVSSARRPTTKQSHVKPCCLSA
jgi:hypothetical protein